MKGYARHYPIKPRKFMKHLCCFLIAVFTGCTEMNKNEDPKKEIADILKTVLPYEGKKIERLGLAFGADSTISSYPKIIYVIPGVPYNDEMRKEQLAYALDNLGGEFHELKLDKRTYNDIVDSIIVALEFAFKIPENASEFDRQMKAGNVLAVLELHNIWVSKKKDRCFYYSKTSHRSNNFYYAFPSVSVFKKVQDKWVFEKNFNR